MSRAVNGKDLPKRDGMLQWLRREYCSLLSIVFTFLWRPNVELKNTPNRSSHRLPYIPQACAVCTYYLYPRVTVVVKCTGVSGGDNPLHYMTAKKNERVTTRSFACLQLRVKHIHTHRHNCRMTVCVDADTPAYTHPAPPLTTIVSDANDHSSDHKTRQDLTCEERVGVVAAPPPSAHERARARPRSCDRLDRDCCGAKRAGNNQPRATHKHA